MYKLIPLFAILSSFSLLSQKQVLDHVDYDKWSTIKGVMLSPDGNYALYALEKGEKDSFLKVKDINGTHVFEHERSSKGMFSYDSKYVFFNIEAWKDSVTAMKSRKVKKKDLPKDTLGILDLKTRQLVKIANLKSYKAPEKWVSCGVAKSRNSKRRHFKICNTFYVCKRRKGFCVFDHR